MRVCPPSLRDESRSAPHGDRATGGAKRIVVSLRRMSIESGRSLAEARTQKAAPIPALPLAGRKAEGYRRRRGDATSLSWRLCRPQRPGSNCAPTSPAAWSRISSHSILTPRGGLRANPARSRHLFLPDAGALLDTAPPLCRRIKRAPGTFDAA